jgi:hypothetical protein
MLKVLGATLLAGIALAAAPLASAQQPQAPAPAAPQQLRDAREQTPGLIGLWKADLNASTYAAPAQKPKTALRSFAYTEDGKVLVTFMTLNAAGRYSTGHWAAQVDGTPAVEYHSAGGSIPYNIVNFTKVDDKNFNLIVTRAGHIDIRATYKLSDDQKTLTYAYGGNTIVYKRWEAMDW